MSTNLTSDAFMIFLSDPENILTNADGSPIAWETCSGFVRSGEPIRTSNGRRRSMIPTRGEVQPITIGRASNVDDDRRIWRWYTAFCSETPLIEGATDSGAILQVIPLRPCSGDEPYDFSGKAYGIIPTSCSLFENIDKKNITDTSTTTLVLVATEIDFS